MPGRVSPSLVPSSAMPKSAIFTSPLRPSSTLAGLRSRWIVPLRVDRLEAAHDLERDQRRHAPGKAAHGLERGAQVDAVHVLLRDVVLAAPGDPVVDRDHVLVVHARRRRAPRARSARPARRSRRARGAGASAPRGARASRGGRAAPRPCRPLPSSRSIEKLPIVRGPWPDIASLGRRPLLVEQHVRGRDVLALLDHVAQARASRARTRSPCFRSATLTLRAVHAHAVRAAQVAQPVAAVAELEHRVLARDRRVVEHDVAARAATRA